MMSNVKNPHLQLKSVVINDWMLSSPTSSNLLYVKGTNQVNHLVKFQHNFFHFGKTEP